MNEILDKLVLLAYNNDCDMITRAHLLDSFSRGQSASNNERLEIFLKCRKRRKAHFPFHLKRK